MTEELRTPAEWSEQHGITVIDPDGWRRDGKDWNDPITMQEFRERAFVSTIGPLDYWKPTASERPWQPPETLVDYEE